MSPDKSAGALPLRSTSTAAVLPLVALHAFSFVAWIIFLAGTSAVDHQLSKHGESSAGRENATSFAWFLVVAYVVAMGASAAVVLVAALQPLQLFAAILLAITCTWFGYETDQIAQYYRTVHSEHLLHVSALLSGTQCAWAGAVLCIFAMLAALALLTIHMSKASATAVPCTARSATGGQVPAYGTNAGPNVQDASLPAAPGGMLQARCPRCSALTSHPPDFDAVCCAKCQNIIQLKPTAV